MEIDLATVNMPPMARFAVVLFLILCIPYITRHLRLPSVVGFILAGVLVGPHGIGVLPAHAQTAEFFAELGKLLLMFFAGLEVDMRQFRQNRSKSLIFGLVTFSLPFAAGFFASLSFGYGTLTAVLVGSLLASHTLIAYPIVIAAGLAKRPAVTVTVGATILTDILSLLVLAICVTTHVTGFSLRSLAIQLGELALFVGVMVGIVGPVGRWVFERLGKSDELCFLLMMVIVAAGATFAELLQLEGILGAFLAGLAVNESVRGTEAKAKIEFLGNNLFIPAFFIVTGFLIDLKVFAATVWSNTALVLAIVLGLVVAKWIAAQAVGRAWGYSADDRGLMVGLTLPQVAATLASALVGYQAVNGSGQRLIDDAMLNTVLVLVIVTSVLGPVMVEYFVRRAGASALAPGGACLRARAKRTQGRLIRATSALKVSQCRQGLHNCRQTHRRPEGGATIGRRAQSRRRGGSGQGPGAARRRRPGKPNRTVTGTRPRSGRWSRTHAPRPVVPGAWRASPARNPYRHRPRRPVRSGSRNSYCPRSRGLRRCYGPSSRRSRAR